MLTLCFPPLTRDLSQTQEGPIYLIHWIEFIAFHGKVPSSLYLCFSHHLTTSDFFLLENVQNRVQISAQTLMPLLTIKFSRNSFGFFPRQINSLWTQRTSLGFGGFYLFVSPFFSLLPLLRFPARILSARWIVSVMCCTEESKASTVNGVTAQWRDKKCTP